MNIRDIKDPLARARDLLQATWSITLNRQDGGDGRQARLEVQEAMNAIDAAISLLEREERHLAVVAAKNDRDSSKIAPPKRARIVREEREDPSPEDDSLL